MGSTAIGQLPYRIDSTFGTDGIVIPGYPSDLNAYQQSTFFMDVMPDNKILLAGSNLNNLISLTRLLDDGRVDSSFGSNGIASFSKGGEFRHLTITSGGEIILTGTAHASAASFFSVAKLTTTGAPAPGFGVNGVVNIPSQLQWEMNSYSDVQPDGKILTCGSYSPSGMGPYRYKVVRLLPNGTMDPAFGTGGYVVCSFAELDQHAPISNSASVVKALPGGKFLVAGSFVDTATMTNSLFLVRYLSDGTPDISFGANGLCTVVRGPNENFTPNDLFVDSLGGIFVVGEHDGLFPTRTGVIKISGNGVHDGAYGTGGIASINLFDRSAFYRWFGAALYQDTALLIVGNTDTGMNASYGVCRLNSSGTIDSSFGVHGVFAYERNLWDHCRTMAVQSTGDILLAGDGKSSAVNDTFYTTCVRITNRPFPNKVSPIRNDDPQIMLYPNPSYSGVFNLRLMGEGQLSRIQVVDIHGRLIDDIEIDSRNGKEFSYKLPGGSTGAIYFMTYQLKGGQQSRGIKMLTR